MNRVIVCDTGPLLHLNEANALHLLKPAGKILIPPGVVLELKHNAPHWKIPNWMNVKRLRMLAKIVCDFRVTEMLCNRRNRGV